MGVRAGPEPQQVRGGLDPDYTLWRHIRKADRGVRRADRPATVDNAADGTAAVMGARLTGLIALIVGGTVVTDNSWL